MTLVVATCYTVAILCLTAAWRRDLRASERRSQKLKKESARLLAYGNQLASELSECRKLQKKTRHRREQAADLLNALSKIHALAARATGHDLSSPVEVGDPEKDPLHVEISFCGPKHVSVYASRWANAPPNDDIRFGGFGGMFIHTDRRLLTVCDGVGHALLADVEKITEAVNHYNQSYHASKGVEDAGAVTEEGRTDPDRQGHQDHGSQDSRRQGAHRSGSPAGRACRPS